MKNTNIAAIICVSLAVPVCEGENGSEFVDGTGQTGDQGNPDDPGQTTGGGGPGPEGTDTEDDEGSGATDDDSGGTFITAPDTGRENDCDVWAQDCPPGEKCMPWDASGGTSWNALKCSPVDPSPAQPGDPCEVEGSGVSGIDTCDVGSMCWDVDSETNTGYCVSFCEGSAAAATCADPEALCTIFNEGVLPLCLPVCDPILQDCVSDDLCVGAPDRSGFVCVLDASGEEGQHGDPCEYVNSCDPGLFCAGAAAVPGCTGSQGCCSEFCDLTDADPDAACSGAADGQECVAWFEEGQAPPGMEHVGGCLIPE
jgi:hypothetical protein